MYLESEVIAVTSIGVRSVKVGRINVKSSAEIPSAFTLSDESFNIP
jgi:hypothetical protein